MITAITGKNNEKYRQLFEAASEILSGFQSVQTYDRDYVDRIDVKDPEDAKYGKYFIKNPEIGYTDISLNDKDENGEIIETDHNNKMYNFALALEKYGKIYKWVGQSKDAQKGFSSKLGITSLEEYYSWLPVLKYEIIGEEKKPTIFTKLPLDEPHFKINPNRSISIPDEFKKNGIGVQGDDLAEVVYFEIDRYQDSMDLHNCEIYIEWETPKGKNNDITKAVSSPYLTILSNDENYNKMVFGWAISEAITKNSGTLKFAIRFIQTNDKKEIVYSFNTLTAQVTIHPNLGISMAEAIKNVENNNDRLLERIQESEVVGGTKPQSPYFLVDLKNIEEFEYDLLGEDGRPDHKNGKYRLYVAATASDTGMVECSWKKNILNENNKPVDNDRWLDIEDYSKTITGREARKLTQQELEDFGYKLPEDHIYYVDDDKTSLSKAQYSLLDANVQNDFRNKYAHDINIIPDGINIKEDTVIPKIYEMRDYLDVTEANRYKAVAKNRIFSGVRVKDSKIATFPRPSFVVINEQNPTGHLHLAEDDTRYSKYTNPISLTHDEAKGINEYTWLKRSNDGYSNSTTYQLDPQLEGAMVKYGEDRIRVCYKKNTVFISQNPNTALGGDPNNFYLRLKAFAPEGTVAYRRGSQPLYNDETKTYRTFDDVEYEAIKLLHPNDDNKEHTGTDGKSYFRDNYLTVARRNSPEENFVYDANDSHYVGYIIKYEWLDGDGVDQEPNVIGTSQVIVELATEANYDEHSEYYFKYEEIDHDTLTLDPKVVEPGYYKLKVTRTRNAAKTSQESIEYRITNEPITPTWNNSFNEFKDVLLSDLQKPEHKGFEISWNKPDEVDGYEIYWYKIEDTTNKTIPVGTQYIDNADILSATFNPWKVKLLGDNEDNYDGLYYAIIRTKLNGVLSNEDATNVDKDVKDKGKMFLIRA